MFWVTVSVILGLLKALAYTILGLFDALLPRRKKFPDLSADICLVTGAGGGLGRELARKFASCGATLVLWDINLESIQTVAEEISADGGEAHAYACDCSKKEEVYETAECVREEVGDVAVLVNCAGILLPMCGFLDKKDEDLERIITVNIFGCIWTTKAFLPWMMNNNYGYVVSVSSIASFLPMPSSIGYGASKAAVSSFMETLRCELMLAGKNGVTVTCVCPSAIDTPMLKELPAAASSAYMLKPEYVAERILQAVAYKDHLVTIPRYLELVKVIKCALPEKAFMATVECNPAVKEIISILKKVKSSKTQHCE